MEGVKLKRFLLTPKPGALLVDVAPGRRLDGGVCGTTAVTPAQPGLQSNTAMATVTQPEL